APTVALLEGVHDDDVVQSILGPTPRARLAADLGATSTLRDTHGAAIAGAIRSAKPGGLLVIGAEGHPGIGKTHAVMESLKSMETGFLWIYASPRLVINSDVTRKMARVNGTPTGVLTMTTNQRLIAGARRQQRDLGGGFVSAAVVVDGVRDFVSPDGAIRYV